MKVYPVEQGTEAWRKIRLGIPTSSRFHKILTPTGKLSSQAKAYAHELIAEELLGRPLESLDNLQWLERGIVMEEEAVKLYEMAFDQPTLPVGFITNDAGTLGCSPDRLIKGAHAGLEVKCAKPNTHVGYLLEGFGADYIPQVMGQIYVAEFDWVDRFGYHPELPPVRTRTYRDEAYIAKLAVALDEFTDMLGEMRETARKSGALFEKIGAMPRFTAEDYLSA